MISDPAAGDVSPPSYLPTNIAFAAIVDAVGRASAGDPVR